MKKKKQKCENKILTNTPLIFLNLVNRNILIVLLTKNPKVNDKKSIDIVIKMIQENSITPKVISILLR